MKQKQCIGLIFGGKSAEHEVSLHSAQNIFRAIDKEKYQVTLIYITREGHWLSFDEQFLFLPDAEIISTMQRVATTARDATEQFYHPSQLKGIAIIFPALHGPFGEDGTIQAFLNMVDIPFIGSSVLGSAIGMDKDVMKRLLRDAGVPIVPFLVYHNHERTQIAFTEVASVLGCPFFVKPANLGSSIGVHKVTDEASFQKALTDAFSYDTKIIIEKGIEAREIECAVLGNDDPLASLPGEIIPTHEFYSYEAKYLDENGATLQIPADLSDRQSQTIQQLALKTFKTLCAAGMARVDFLLEKKTGKIFVNEINTIPGFTDSSMYPALWEASGISYPELIERLIELGMTRFNQEKKLKTNVH